MRAMAAEEVPCFSGAAEDLVQACRTAIEAAKADVQRISVGGEQGVLQRLQGGVQEKLLTIKAHLRKIEVEVEAADSDQESQALQSQLEQLNCEYNQLRPSLRNANLQAKRHAEQAARRERELLFGGSEDAILRRRKLQTQAEMAAAAEDVTDSLRRSRQIMEQEVQRGADTLENMAESNRLLKQTDEEYTSQRSVLGRTRRMLALLQRQDVQDRLIVIIGSFLFLLICTYVLWKRLPLINKISVTRLFFPKQSPPIGTFNSELQHTQPSAGPTPLPSGWMQPPGPLPRPSSPDKPPMTWLVFFQLEFQRVSELVLYIRAQMLKMFTEKEKVAVLTSDSSGNIDDRIEEQSETVLQGSLEENEGPPAIASSNGTVSSEGKNVTEVILQTSDLQVKEIPVSAPPGINEKGEDTKLVDEETGREKLEGTAPTSKVTPIAPLDPDRRRDEDMRLVDGETGREKSGETTSDSQTLPIQPREVGAANVDNDTKLVDEEISQENLGGTEPDSQITPIELLDTGMYRVDEDTRLVDGETGREESGETSSDSQTLPIQPREVATDNVYNDTKLVDRVTGRETLGETAADAQIMPTEILEQPVLHSEPLLYEEDVSKMKIMLDTQMAHPEVVQPSLDAPPSPPIGHHAEESAGEVGHAAFTEGTSFTESTAYVQDQSYLVTDSTEGAESARATQQEHEPERSSAGVDGLVDRARGDLTEAEPESSDRTELEAVGVISERDSGNVDEEPSVFGMASTIAQEGKDNDGVASTLDPFLSAVADGNVFSQEATESCTKTAINGVPVLTEGELQGPAVGADGQTTIEEVDGCVEGAQEIERDAVASLAAPALSDESAFFDKDMQCDDTAEHEIRKDSPPFADDDAGGQGGCHVQASSPGHDEL